MAPSWPREPSTPREPGVFPARRTSNRYRRERSMARRTFVLLTAATVALITLAACSSGGSSASGSSSGSNKITIGSDQANDHGTQDATGTSTFTIGADNDSSGYFFNPTILLG